MRGRGLLGMETVKCMLFGWASRPDASTQRVTPIAAMEHEELPCALSGGMTLGHFLTTWGQGHHPGIQWTVSQIAMAITSQEMCGGQLLRSKGITKMKLLAATTP